MIFVQNMKIKLDMEVLFTDFKLKLLNIILNMSFTTKVVEILRIG
jgi:hypothetical protein